MAEIVHNPAMLWDVFCRVIDNYGDIGVCWRLARDLASRGETVRLWVNDASALAWMAPNVQWRGHADASGAGFTAASGETIEVGVGEPGVTVRHWRDAADASTIDAVLVAGDVVVEAFGCDPPDAFVAGMQTRAAQGRPAHWLNLEYLSAEDYVARSHGLVSPVWSGVGAGLRKRFFYPGFTAETGGLLREPGLLARRQAETAPLANRAALLAPFGVRLQAGEACVLVFCYDGAPLSELLSRLDREAAPVHVLLTPGPAARLAEAWSPGGGAVRLHHLPALPQDRFDQLLWCADLNLVRGEDSAVRALWAGRPHIWHIYEQDDGVHAAKLEAFMDRWMAHWPEPLREEVRAWWLGWNRLAPLPERLPAWRPDGPPDEPGALSAWRGESEKARAPLLAQPDLVTQLLPFVTSSG